MLPILLNELYDIVAASELAAFTPLLLHSENVLLVTVKFPELG